MENVDAEINCTSMSIWLHAISEVFAASVLNRPSHLVQFPNLAGKYIVAGA